MNLDPGGTTEGYAFSFNTPMPTTPRSTSSGTDDAAFGFQTNHHQYTMPPPIGGSYHPPSEHSFMPLVPPPSQPIAYQVQQLNHHVMNNSSALQELQTRTHSHDQVLASICKKIAELEAENVVLKQKLVVSHPIASSAKTKTQQRKDIPSEVRNNIKDAVQRAAKALIDASEVREPSETGEQLPMKLVLPPPHNAEGVVPRTSGGHTIFNPDWHKNKKDAYNERYINAIITTVSNLVTNGKIVVPAEYQPPQLIRHAAEQFFLTLQQNYRIQTDENEALKKVRKLEAAKHLQRKRAKTTHRLTSWPVFQKKHGIEDDFRDLIDIGYMSEDDESCGNILASEWNAEAKKICGPGQTALEIRRVPWRTEKLTRFYYALDKEGYTPSSGTKRPKVVYARFHGFHMNADQTNPARHCTQGLVPHYIVDEHWLKETNNQDLPLDTAPEPLSWQTLVINDDEIDSRDLQALQKWDEERQGDQQEESS